MKYPMPSLQTGIIGITTLLVCLTVVAGSGHAGAEKVTVVVKGSCQVTGKTILLKDIADITGDNDIAKEIGIVRIGSSPKPGKKKKIPARLIRSRLRKYNTNYGEMLAVQLPDIIYVTRAYQVISEAELKKIFYRYVSDKAGGREFRVTDVRVRGNKPVPTGKINITIDEKNNRSVRGRVSIALNVRGGDNSYSKFYVSGRVDLFDDIVVADKDIEKGGIVSGADISLKSLSITSSPPDIIYNLQDAVGKEATSKIEKGRPLQKRMIKSPSVVEKGDIVKLIAKSGLLTVSTVGVAKHDGKIGEQIPVENPTSGKVVVGRVVQADIVEVVF